ncbi:MAG: EAL domain-containing protein [Pseudomonadota bacterium]
MNQRPNDTKENLGQNPGDLHERLRALASWIGFLGFFANAAGYLAMVAVGDVTLLLTIENGTYAIIFAAFFYSSRADFHVRRVLYTGLVVIYSIFWFTAFGYAEMGQDMVLAVPVVAFVPLLLVIVLDYRIVLSLAPVQFVCMYFYTSNHALRSLDTSISPENTFVFALTMAAFSSFTLCAIAIVARERAITDRKLVRLIDDTEAIATTDDLTGLLNRRAFMAELNDRWDARGWTALAFVDLDHFKPLNDQYGHSVGDYLLGAVAGRLGLLSKQATVARLGGDEFAIAFHRRVSSDDLLEMMREMHSTITADYQSDVGPVSIGASIGFAESGGDVDSLSKLLRAADAAMRRAKAGRSGWARYEPREDSAALAHSSLEVGLKRAVRNGRIAGAVQPIANAESYEIVEYELLARWPDSGFSIDPSPAEFIHIAEKLGLLNEILWLTLAEALSTLDLSRVRLAINVSPAQLLASDFLTRLVALLEQYNTEPSRITLEITEEVVYRNLDKNVSALRHAQKLGMSIALDDFGSGYSSLSMLDALPLNKLKIDKSLVRKAQTSERSANILYAAVNLAKQLDLTCCVEGVETAEAARDLSAVGADQIQGYWLGKPELLRKREQRLRLVS